MSFFKLRSVSIWAMSFIAMWIFVLAPVHAAETIKSYSSNITLHVNGSVDVIETIVVSVEGLEIKRGIFRDIPTTLRNDDGSIIQSNLNIISVQRDGETEPFHTSGIEGGTRIYVGESSVFLPHQTFTYTLHYTMSRMARYFDDHDELYWNATGNFWNFAIEQAVAQVTLPDGAIINDLSVYTGAQGANESDAKTRTTADNVALFRATRLLFPKEGMSVSVSFQKGILTEPSSTQKGLNFLSDHRKNLFPILAFLLIAFYYYYAWDKVGRDPEKGTIIPLFHAPEGYSPALVHFIHNMGWKKSGWTAYSAAMVSLATRGLLDIEKDGKKKITFKHLSNPDEELPRGEKVIADYLKQKDKITVNKSSGPGLNSNRSKFIKAIISENQHAYFNHNFLYSALGIALSILSILGLVAGGILPPAQGIIMLAVGFGASIFFFAISSAMGTGGFGKFIILGWFGLVGVNLMGNFASLLTPLTINTPFIATVSIVLLNVVFIFLMRAPTIHGRKVMDQIDGFKMYLETAEKNRLNFLSEPDFSIKRFEQILPYAIALGVEKPWAQRLEGEFSRNALEEARGGYHPHWYHGSSFSSGDLSKSVSGIASSMSAAMVSAQPSSSSSSGSSGGGFSGGGGGGGGGGGW